MPTNNPTKARYRDLHWAKRDLQYGQGKTHHSGYCSNAPSGRSGGSKYGANDDDFDDGYDEGYGWRREDSYYENCEADEIGHFTADGNDEDYDDADSDDEQEEEWLDCSSSDWGNDDDDDDDEGQPRYHKGHVPAMSLSLATLIASTENRRQRKTAAAQARLERHHAANPEAAAARAELVAELEQLGISGFEATDAMLADPMVAERLRQFAIAAQTHQAAHDDEDGMGVELTSADYVLYDASHETLAYRIPVELWDIVTLYAPPRSTIALACTSHWMRLAVEETGFWPRLRYSCRTEISGRWKGKPTEERLLPRVLVRQAVKSYDGRGANLWERPGIGFYSGYFIPAPKFPWSEFWSFFHFVRHQCSCTHIVHEEATHPPRHTRTYNYYAHRLIKEQRMEQRKTALLAYTDGLPLVAIIAWIELHRSANLSSVRDFARMQANRYSGMPNLALELLETAEPLPPRVAARLGAPTTNDERRALISELTMSSLSSDREAEWDVTEHGANAVIKSRDCNEGNKPEFVANKRPVLQTTGHRRRRGGPVARGRKRYHSSGRSTDPYDSKELSLSERRLAMQVGFAKIANRAWSGRTCKKSFFMSYWVRDAARALLSEPASTSTEISAKDERKKLRDGLSIEDRCRGVMPYNEQVERIQRPVVDA